MDDLLADAAARAIRYRRAVNERPVFPGREAIDGLQAFVEALPEEPAADTDVLELLDDAGSPATVATAGGRYFGFVTGSSYPAGLAASWLATSWDQNAAVGVMSPTAAVLDTVAGSWLCSLFGLPSSAQVSFVPGSSMANSTCLAAARDHLHAGEGWDSVADGLYGAPPVRVVVSDAAHSSIDKALGFVGLGRNRVVRVPADEQGRIRVDELPEPGVPTIVVAQAGNVNSGAFDDFDAIADHFEGSPTWIHVDGAFGLWAAASPSRQHLTAGVARAHSWAADMHKWLNVTYDSAVAIVADKADLARTFHVGAAYIPDGGRLDPLSRTADMSQRARAVETWAVLKSLGRRGVAELIDRTSAHATRIGEELAQAGLHVHNDVVINQVMVSLDTDEATDAMMNTLAEGGIMWAGGSMWDGRRVMRISVSSWATTDDDIDRSVAAIIDAAHEHQLPTKDR